jgi:hypothetical protein
MAATDRTSRKRRGRGCHRSTNVTERVVRWDGQVFIAGGQFVNQPPAVETAYVGIVSRDTNNVLFTTAV